MIFSFVILFLVFIIITSFSFLSRHNLQSYHNKQITEIKLELEGYYFNSLQTAVFSLSKNNEVVNLLKGATRPDNKNILTVLNTTKLLYDAAIVYTIDKKGIVKACSPYDNNQTLTGHNFSFRPYFKKAMSGKKYIYPALGVVTNERGVYFSSPVFSNSRKEIIGVMVIKMDMDKVDQILKGSRHPVFLLSQDGIIFATNISKWLYRSALPLSRTDIDIIKKSKQFYNQPLDPMPELLNRNTVRLDGTAYNLLKESISYTGWDIIYLVDSSHSASLTREQIFTVIFILMGILLLLVLIFFLLKSNEERKIAELRALKNEENFRNLFSLAPDAIVITTREGKLVSYNENFKKIFGYSDRDLADFNISGLYKNPDDDRNKIIKALDEQGKLKDYFVLFIDSSGHEVPSTISSSNITFRDRESVETVIRDMREIIKRDNQLHQIQKMEMIGTLAGGLAHDFNNVLGGIIGTLSLMDFHLHETETFEKNKLQKYLDTLNEASSRASEMINQLLLISKKQNLSFVTADLNHCIDNVIHLCENSFDKSINISFTPFNEPALSEIDTNLIEQSILNIAINSSHAMTIMKDNESKWGGDLALTIEKINRDSPALKGNPDIRPSDYWKISVTDTGVGIPRENLQKIFDPFFTTKKGKKSIGLGLSMTYNVIKQHNGFIEVNSTPGEGTTFRIYVPVSDNKTVSARVISKTETTIVMGTGTVLVVDDENLMRKTARRILEKCGYTVITAEDGMTAIDIFKSRNSEINAILLDMVMPNISGRETFLEINKINSKVPVLLASGYLKDERIEELLNLGIKSFIQKPYTLSSLSKSISEIITEKY